MDIARSGIHQQISLTPEMENEIKQAETQIKRRIGIGNHISERRLIDDLSRMGMNESIGFAYLLGGICASNMNRPVSYDQAIAWKVLHC
ncbi:DNA replication licensing factor MCM5-like [Arachis hypogaea]|uniref:DNA replication licensing factor MCM5-like n=1 Tax=Arachis hypogaea TaxID=3818 RepID=UPI003B05ED62